MPWQKNLKTDSARYTPNFRPKYQENSWWNTALKVITHWLATFKNGCNGKIIGLILSFVDYFVYDALYIYYLMEDIHLACSETFNVQLQDCWPSELVDDVP